MHILRYGIWSRHQGNFVTPHGASESWRKVLWTPTVSDESQSAVSPEIFGCSLKIQLPCIMSATFPGGKKEKPSCIPEISMSGIGSNKDELKLHEEGFENGKLNKTVINMIIKSSPGFSLITDHQRSINQMWKHKDKEQKMQTSQVIFRRITTFGDLHVFILYTKSRSVVSGSECGLVCFNQTSLFG